MKIEKDETIKKVKERISYHEGLESEIIFLKFKLEEEENALKGGIIELRNQLEKIKRGKKVKVSILEGNLVGKENQL